MGRPEDIFAAWWRSPSIWDPFMPFIIVGFLVMAIPAIIVGLKETLYPPSPSEREFSEVQKTKKNMRKLEEKLPLVGDKEKRDAFTKELEYLVKRVSKGSD